MKIVLAPTFVTAIGYWLFGLPSAWLLLREYGLAGVWGESVLVSEFLVYSCLHNLYL